MEYTEIVAQGGLIVSILLVINQLLKNTFSMPDKYAPLVNVVLGAGLTIALNYGKDDLVLLILKGILVGASAGGIYDLKRLASKEDPTKNKVSI